MTQSPTQASMYTLSVPIFDRTLANLAAIVDKAAAHAEARRIDPAALLGARLYPDMFPFTRQVQIACDFAKGASARLAAQQPPSWEDKELSFADLKARIARTREFIATFKPAQFEGAETRTIEIPVRGEITRYAGLPYLAHNVLPNFFFHATTAYDILRHSGVELGKRDFLGAS
jgi:uncharacterized protein